MIHSSESISHFVQLIWSLIIKIKTNQLNRRKKFVEDREKKMNREKKKIFIIFIIFFLLNLIILKMKSIHEIDQENNCLSKKRKWKRNIYLFFLFSVEKYRSKLFCFILISKKHFNERAKILFETWGKRCGTFRFVLQFKNKKEKENFQNENHFPIIELSPFSSFSSSFWNSSFDDNYLNLSEKLRQTIFHLYSNYQNYFWYLKADDDTFIIIENLLRLLITKTKLIDQRFSF